MKLRKILTTCAGFGIVFFSTSFGQLQKYSYFADPNHRSIVLRAYELARQLGVSDADMDSAEIVQRLQNGAYCEDYVRIPGVPGESSQTPWLDGPIIDFRGLFPTIRIPYGEMIDSLSGWCIRDAWGR